MYVRKTFEDLLGLYLPTIVGYQSANEMSEPDNSSRDMTLSDALHAAAPMSSFINVDYAEEDEDDDDLAPAADQQQQQESGSSVHRQSHS